jgi:glycosyltransferase involved in cell wall biosynthesis
VIVPVHNEGHWIAEKIQNLRALQYPDDQLRIWIVDGASSDSSPVAALKAIGGDPRFTVLSETIADKTTQLNAALRQGRGRWVMVTDADARLPPETLRNMIALGEADTSLAVIGTQVTPQCAHPLEQLHWRISNALRRREGVCGFASMVVGPCYLFQRSLLDQFPSDVIADDVHVSFRAAAAERRVGFMDAGVQELRSPLTVADLLRQKIRKCDAYLREIYRFVPQLERMGRPARQIFAWRALQFIVAPAATAIATIVAVTSAAANLPVSAYLFGAALAGLLGLAARWRWPYLSQLGPSFALAGVLTVALLAATAMYPLSRFRQFSGGSYELDAEVRRR